MFAKQWKARIEKAGIKMTRINREEAKGCAVQLVYPFTDALADAIGGDAIGAQKMLDGAGDASCRVADQKLVIDSSDVKLTMSAGKDERLVIDHTTRLVAKAKRPTKDGGTDPVLVVDVAWTLDDEVDDDLAFLKAHLGETLGCRMDRRQGELALSEDE